MPLLTSSRPGPPPPSPHRQLCWSLAHFIWSTLASSGLRVWFPHLGFRSASPWKGNKLQAPQHCLSSPPAEDPPWRAALTASTPHCGYPSPELPKLPWCLHSSLGALILSEMETSHSVPPPLPLTSQYIFPRKSRNFLHDLHFRTLLWNVRCVHKLLRSLKAVLCLN